MTTVQQERLNTTFSALADPTRRAIVERLSKGDASLNELAEPFAMTLQAVSQHLKVLESAGLVTRGRIGQQRPARLEGDVLDEAMSWLDRYHQVWQERYDRLDEHLARTQAPNRVEPGTNDPTTKENRP